MVSPDLPPALADIADRRGLSRSSLVSAVLSEFVATQSTPSEPS